MTQLEFNNFPARQNYRSKLTRYNLINIKSYLGVKKINTRRDRMERQ